MIGASMDPSSSAVIGGRAAARFRGEGGTSPADLKIEIKRFEIGGAILLTRSTPSLFAKLIWCTRAPPQNAQSPFIATTPPARCPFGSRYGQPRIRLGLRPILPCPRCNERAPSAIWRRPSCRMGNGKALRQRLFPLQDDASEAPDSPRRSAVNRKAGCDRSVHHSRSQRRDRSAFQL